MTYDTSPLSNPLFYYNAISYPDRRGVYQATDAVLICDTNVLQAVAFISVCRRHLIIVRRLFGQFKTIEV